MTAITRIVPPHHSQDFIANLNPTSLEALTECWVEPSLASATPGSIYQFERQSLFCADPDSVQGKRIFNRAVSLKDEWARIEKARQIR